MNTTVSTKVRPRSGRLSALLDALNECGLPDDAMLTAADIECLDVAGEFSHSYVTLTFSWSERR